MNYGAIGFVIGHEITHGFDDQGRQFNKEGNLVDWWEPETKEHYLKRAECIIYQYGNYTVKDVGMNVRRILYIYITTFISLIIFFLQNSIFFLYIFLYIFYSILLYSIFYANIIVRGEISIKYGRNIYIILCYINSFASFLFL